MYVLIKLIPREERISNAREDRIAENLSLNTYGIQDPDGRVVDLAKSMDNSFIGTKEQKSHFFPLFLNLYPVCHLQHISYAFDHSLLIPAISI